MNTVEQRLEFANRQGPSPSPGLFVFTRAEGRWAEILVYEFRIPPDLRKREPNFFSLERAEGFVRSTAGIYRELGFQRVILHEESGAEFVFEADSRGQWILVKRIDSGTQPDVSGTTRSENGSEVVARIYGMIEALGARGGQFTPLQRAEIRKNFLDYLVALNPTVAQVTPAFLERQWVAYSYGKTF